MANLSLCILCAFEYNLCIQYRSTQHYSIHIHLSFEHFTLRPSIAVLAYPNRHTFNGVTQYDYLETVGAKLGGQAKRLLDNFVDRRDNTKEGNPCHEDVVTREVSRAIWITYYKRKAIFELHWIQVSTDGDIPLRP